jgi:hypothetical protein
LAEVVESFCEEELAEKDAQDGDAPKSKRCRRLASGSVIVEVCVVDRHSVKRDFVVRGV